MKYWLNQTSNLDSNFRISFHFIVFKINLSIIQTLPFTDLYKKTRFQSSQTSSITIQVINNQIKSLLVINFSGWIELFYLCSARTVVKTVIFAYFHKLQQPQSPCFPLNHVLCAIDLFNFFLLPFLTLQSTFLPFLIAKNEEKATSCSRSKKVSISAIVWKEIKITTARRFRPYPSFLATELAIIVISIDLNPVFPPQIAEAAATNFLSRAQKPSLASDPVPINL